jgi:hypothetical protein
MRYASSDRCPRVRLPLRNHSLGTTGQRVRNDLGQFANVKGLSDCMRFADPLKESEIRMSLTKTMGNFGRRARTRRATSAPLMPGMAKSNKSRSIF